MSSHSRVPPPPPPRPPRARAGAVRRLPAPASSAPAVPADGFDAGAKQSALRLTATSTAALTPPPPAPPNATPEQARQSERAWQQFNEQYQLVAQAALFKKATGYPFPDPAAEAVRSSGASEGPFVAGRSSLPGQQNTPVFFTDHPSSADRQMQIYAYVAPPDADPAKSDSWVSFEIAGDILRAYADGGAVGERVGTQSALGFPSSGREDAVATAPPFLNDPEINRVRLENRSAGRSDTLTYQAFQGGYLVELGGGKVAAFALDGSRLNGPPSSAAPLAAPTGAGSARASGSVYAPFEVAPGASVGSRLGFSWPADLSRPFDATQAEQIIARAKELGAGYTTLILAPGQESVQAELIATLQKAGITPVVRLYNPRPPDEWTDADLDAMAQQAKTLAGMGVQLVQVGNEPNIEGQLIRDGAPRLSNAVYMERSAARQAEAMLRIRGAAGEGIKIGIPPMAAGSPDDDQGHQAPQTYFKVLVRAIAEQERKSGVKIADFIATHNYAIDDGVELTETVGGGGARGQLGFGPRANRWYEEQAAAALGRSLKALSTEGGATAAGVRDSDPGRVAREMTQTLAQLNADNGLTANLWLLFESKKGSDNWDRFALDGRDSSFTAALSSYRKAYQAAQ